MKSGPTQPPGILILSLTNACACHCIFCDLPNQSNATLLPRDLLIALLDNAPDGRCWSEVNVTGGDPLVIPAVQGLLRDIVARRDRYETLSLCSAGIPARQALRGLDAVSADRELALYLSLDGVGEMHDRVRGRKGAFGEVQKFIDVARQRPRLRLSLNCVINALNVDCLDEIADHADLLRLPIAYSVVNSSDHYINSAALYGKSALSASQTETVLDFLYRRSRQAFSEDLVRVLSGGGRQHPCRLLKHGYLVTADGTIAICGTSQRMILEAGRDLDPLSRWRCVLEARGRSLDAVLGDVCTKCTVNCYA